MDFIEGLLNLEGYDTIYVIIDTFSKYAYFLVISHPFTASTIAETFMQNIFKLHSMPISIISNRDKVFTNQFGQSSSKL